MRATIESTDQIAIMGKAGRTRVWEGVTENGVKFVAYVSMVQVADVEDQAEFERDLTENKPASAETMKAIDARML